MPESLPNDRASLLLVEECFAREDGGFIEALRRVESAKYLAAFADRWKKDPRPWARAQIFAYLEQPLDRPGHQPVVKRLYKDAEARRDDELVATFLVAFDALIRRVRRKRWVWDRDTRSSIDEDYLAVPRDVLPRERTLTDPRTGKSVIVEFPRRRPPSGRLFTHRTRQYLRRRAWRYFRWMGYGRPADYPAAIARALRRYRDEDLARGENILDSWALLNICFRGSEVLEFGPVHLRLAPGRTLAELRAAPRFAPAWETAAAVRVLFDLVAQARAQLVRMWAMDLFRQVRAKIGFEPAPEEILALLDHADERVQQFGAELFEAQTGLERLPIDTWLRLLRTRNLTALATLCAAFNRHVSRERLSLAQMIELACAAPAPVARLGQELLSTRAIAPADHPALAALADARCPALAGEFAAWALARLGSREHYDLDLVSRFFDSLSAETRAAAWSWLVAPDSPGANDAALWSRLAESPFDDVRLKLIDQLALRVQTPALSADQLTPVWSAVLLGVHRGGRQKLKAVRDIAEAVEREMERAPQLLPVLAVAVRSVRGPEMRAGLAAVMSLLAARPDLAPAVRERLPELQFETTEGAR